MTKKLLAGVAVLALIAGSGVASAQQGQPQQGGSAPQMHEGKNNSPAPRSSEENTVKEPEGRAHDATPKQTQSAPAGDKATGERSGSAATQDRNGATQRQTQDRKQDGQRSTQTESKPGGGKAASAELNSEQRTKISQTIKTQNVKRVTNVNFNVSVGTVVPRSYTFYPVPATVVAVVPAYRGFLYLVVGDEMLIIHPRTHEIVAVIAV